MTNSCGCPPEAGNNVCDLTTQNFQRPVREVHPCPACGEIGKPIQGQTVEAMVSVTLRRIQDTNYLFCRAPACPVVYFSVDGEQIFVVEEVRERVYQKEPETEDVFICYCFRHTVGDLRAASREGRSMIADDINAGIRAEQCACDLRNPQGTCCLGNIRAMTRRLKTPDVPTS